jgi:hypothetical protein
MRRLDEVRRLEADLREAALILSRAATDKGHRKDFDEAIAVLGYKRAELDADLTAGRG